ncbi:MAG TPA: hypothetical protein VF173_02460 [Thermoanaerobaculia bacterium]|nr:hypothetical protein [Thermoanaerobaculia bacterium]
MTGKAASRSLKSLSLVLPIVLSLLGPRAAMAHVAALNGEELVAASPNVVVAVVESKSSRWNARHTLIVTDYALRVADRLRGNAPERLTITVPGGTLGEITDETCVSVHLQAGERYLLFLGPLAEPTLTPITGAWQGMYREIPDSAGSRVAGGESRSPMSLDGRDVRFEDLVGAVRSLVAKVEAAPVKALRPAPRGMVPLPAKTYDPTPVLLASPLAFPPLAAPPRVLPPVAATEGEEKGVAPTVAADLPRPLYAPFVYLDPARLPIVFNPLPDDSPFSPFDQHQMAYWNVYGGDVFEVMPASSTWSFGNGVFDIAGFPDDGQMLQQFGDTWGGIGAGTLGVTVARRRNGVLMEADVALNPHYSWSTDDWEATEADGPRSFNHSMLHELGHSWGLKHPWETQDVWWDSVMNYRFQVFGSNALFADDTMALRDAFPDHAKSLRDGLISSYHTEWIPFSRTVEYVSTQPSPATVRAGGSFTASGPIKLENPGTVPLANPTVEVYLAPRRLSLAGAVRVKSFRAGGTLQPGATQWVNVGRVTVPKNIKAGTYSLAFLLRDAKDAYQANNVDWTVDGVTLTVTKR